MISKLNSMCKRIKIHPLLLIYSALLVITGCRSQPAAKIIVTQSSPTTKTLVTLPAQAERPAHDPTQVPEVILFRDDFEGHLMPGWEWVNEDPDKWEFVDFKGRRWLQLTSAEGRTNYLLREAPQGDFSVIAHIYTDPKETFQDANIGVYEDFSNYIVLNIGYCEFCVEGGDAFYMNTYIDNRPLDDIYMIPRDAELKDIYLRLDVDRIGKVTSYYASAENPEVWIKLETIGHDFDVKSVGLGVSNIVIEGQIAQNLEAFFDFFEISKP